MKHTAQPTSSLSRRGGMLLLAALSVFILLLTAACGTHPAQQTRQGSAASLPSVSQTAVPSGSATPAPPVSAVVDVRDVNRALTDSEMRGYAGDAACASCHKQEFAAHSHSNHAHTFHTVSFAQDASHFRASQNVTDTHIKYAYHTSAESGKCLIIGKNAHGQGKIAATYAIGTGRTGISYLGNDARGQWLELRLSYFPKAHTWDFTPGQSEGKDLMRAAGRPLGARDFQQCLGCHATAVRATAEGADVARSLMNVGCERCHGPARAHIFEAAKAFAALSRAKTPATTTEHLTYGMEDLHAATPQRITTICGGCHRSESVAHPLSPVEEPRLARFQGVALSRSACYQKSGTLSCLTCHDSHSNANPSLARNDAICLTCHSGTEKEKRRKGEEERGGIANPTPNTQHSTLNIVCPVNPRTGCTTCHMPKTAGIMPYSLFTNHLIKVWPSNATAPTSP